MELANRIVLAMTARILSQKGQTQTAQCCDFAISARLTDTQSQLCSIKEWDMTEVNGTNMLSSSDISIEHLDVWIT